MHCHTSEAADFISRAGNVTGWTRLAAKAIDTIYQKLTRFATLQAALSLYLHLGSSTLLQLESFLWKLLLPLAEGKGAHSVGRQEVALEVSKVLDQMQRKPSSSAPG